jgi:glycosyltransferase involved in cell wall biosynthesis
MVVHDLIPKIFPDYLDNFRKKIYFSLTLKGIQNADKILSVSEWSKKDIHKFAKVPLDRIEVTYQSLGDEFSERPSEEKDNSILEKYGVYGRYIFYIGGFDFRKNVTGLIEAYAKLVRNYEHSDVRLVLGGEDKSRFSRLFTNLEEEIAKFGLEEKIFLPGYIAQEDLPAFYRNCELFVLPSLYEGFGRMVLEAMASGAPSAVSKSSSLPEIGGDAVLYFNPHDTDEMARVLAKILRNTKLRLRLSEKGRARSKKFNWKSFVQTILEK